MAQKLAAAALGIVVLAGLVYVSLTREVEPAPPATSYRAALDENEVRHAEESLALLEKASVTGRAGLPGSAITKLDLNAGEVWIEPAFWDALVYQARRGVAHELAIVRKARMGTYQEIRIRDAYTGKTLGRWSSSGYTAGE